MNAEMVMHDEEFQQIQGVCVQLHRDAAATAVLLIDKNGQLIADAGDVADLDTVSLSSLTAGNVAATGGIAKLLDEDEFSGQFHEGEKTSVHISLVSQRVIVVILFDNRSSLGLVRLRVRKAAAALTSIFEVVAEKSDKAPGGGNIFGEITDEDIDNLFND